MRPGVAEPCAEDLEWLEHNDAKRWSIQVTAQDLVRIKALQSFPGTVWINSIIRYSRASGQDLKETMDRLHVSTE